jgi:hypothetical protein
MPPTQGGDADAIASHHDGNFKHHLFVSYRREPDRPLAKRIESFLEGFHKTLPPPDTGTKTVLSGRRFEPLQVCLDGSDFSMPAPGAAGQAINRHIDAVIENHLSQCGELLVLCSEAAIQSPFVQREIDWFLRHRGEHYIRLALTEGKDPLRDPARYIPPALLGLGFADRACYDLRGFRRAESKAWYRVDEFERELVRLAGDLLGQPAGLIYPSWLREQRLRQARNRWVWGAALASTAALALLAYTQWQQSNLAASRTIAETAKREAAESGTKAAVSAATAEALKRETAESAAAAEAAIARAATARAVAEEQKASAEATLRGTAQANLWLYRRPEQAFLLADAALNGRSGQAAREPAAQARNAALQVMALRDQWRSRDNLQWDVGAPYIAPTFFTGKLSAKLSRDGRYVLMSTERTLQDGDATQTRDTSGVQGEVYLLDNTTLKLVRLQAPSYQALDGPRRRLEYAGFSSSGRQIYLARQYNIEIYDVSGRHLLTSLNGAGSTKYPISAVDGVLNDSWIVLGDVAGGIYTFSLEANRTSKASEFWMVHHHARDPLLEIESSASGSHTAFLRKSGQVQLWRTGVLQRDAVLTVAESGGTALAFGPGRPSEQLAVGNADGRLSLHAITTPGLANLRTLRHGFDGIGHISFSSDGQRLMSVSAGASARVWDLASGRLLRQVSPGAEAEPAPTWQPQSRDVAAPASQPVQRSAGTPLQELRGIQDIATAGTLTVVLTDKKDLVTFGFDAHLVVEGRAHRLRDDVVGLVHDAEQIWLRTGQFGLGGAFKASYGPAWRVDAQGQALHRPTPQATLQLLLRDGQAWLRTGSEVLRVQDGQLLGMSQLGLTVRQLVRAGQTLWVAADQGLYRSEGAAWMRVSSRPLHLSHAQQVGGDWWFRTQVPPVTSEGPTRSDSQGEGASANAGAAYRLRGNDLVALPDADTRVHAVMAAKGRVWLATERGVFDATGDRPMPVRACTGPAYHLVETTDALWALIGSVGQARHACRIQGGTGRMFVIPDGKLKRVLEAGGKTWLLTRTEQESAGPAYRVDGASLVLTHSNMTAIADVLPDRGGAWLLAQRPDLWPGQAFYWPGPGQPGQPRVLDGLSQLLACRQGSWFATPSGLFATSATTQSIERVSAVPGPARWLKALDGVLWVMTDAGVYRGTGRDFSKFANDGFVNDVKPVDVGGRTYLLLKAGPQSRLVPYERAGSAAASNLTEGRIGSDRCDLPVPASG